MNLRRDKKGVRLGSKERGQKMSIVQEIMFKSSDYLRRIIAPVGGQGGVTMSYLCQNCNSFSLNDYVWWDSAGKTTKWWCAICGEKADWRQPSSLLVVQTGDSFEQAKVFKAHAIPQGLCEILIKALKLLANQQEDGDGLLQNIVTNLRKGSRKGLTDGLRDFIRVDNHMRLGCWRATPRRGNFREEGSDVTIRENPDELTLRAEEVNTSKART